MKILMILDSYFDYFRLIKCYPFTSDLFYFEKNLTKILFLLYKADIKLVLADCAVIDPPLNKIFSLIQEYDKNILLMPYNIPAPSLSAAKYKVYCNFINKSALEILPKDSKEITLYKMCKDFFAAGCEAERGNILKRIFDMFVSKPDKCICLAELSEFVFGKVTKKHINTIYGYIHKLRGILGDDKREPKIVVKVEKGKYRLNLPSKAEVKLF